MKKFIIRSEFSKDILLELDLPALSPVLHLKKHLSIAAVRDHSKIFLKLGNNTVLNDRELVGQVFTNTRPWTVYLCYSSESNNIDLDYTCIITKANIRKHSDMISLSSLNPLHPTTIVRSLHFSPLSDPFFENTDYVGMVIYGRSSISSEEFKMFGQTITPGYILVRRSDTRDMFNAMNNPLKSRSSDSASDQPITAYEALFRTSFIADFIPRDLVAEVFSIDNNFFRWGDEQHRHVFPTWNQFYAHPKNAERSELLRICILKFLELHWERKEIVGEKIALTELLTAMDPLDLSKCFQDRIIERQEFDDSIFAIVHP